ncbi:MAG: hypothetical protein U5N56_10235 [Candidatus Marinimicrobia bacterium]|nr:hypothetical protein [Candidatus Neomarinimicrobiota bacterium]
MHSIWMMSNISREQANLLDELGKYADELEVWEYIIEIKPDDNDAINAIIDVLGKMGRDPKEFYKKAWENNTASASRALKYINALLNDNECGEAIRVAQQSLQYNPSNETLVKKLAQAYEYNNQMLEALKALEDYARKNPRDINMQIEVALKNLEFENYEKASTLFPMPSKSHRRTKKSIPYAGRSWNNLQKPLPSKKTTLMLMTGSFTTWHMKIIRNPGNWEILMRSSELNICMITI